MIKILFKSSCILFSIVLLSFVPRQEKKIMYLVGDSTCANKESKAFPETGWGMPFSYFFDSTVQVDNRAMNGRSTKSFMVEGRWKSVTDQLNEGDYVLIQFGHNDEVQTKATSTKPGEFADNLKKYISETRAKKAIPILITPVARRKFDTNGKVVDTHEQYSEIVRSVAAKHNVHFIDLDKLSQELLQGAGVEMSKLYFNHLQPNEHPNYPEGKQDDTHFNELGARKIAQLVLAEIKKLNVDLSERIINRTIK